MNLSSPDDNESCDDVAKVFYCNGFGYWNGTMVQGMVKERTGTASHQQSYDIKIYNRFSIQSLLFNNHPMLIMLSFFADVYFFSEEIKIQDLVKLIHHHFGSRISIKPVQSNQCRQLELKYRFREEIASLEEIANRMPNGSTDASFALMPFLDYQRRTDEQINASK